MMETSSIFRTSNMDYIKKICGKKLSDIFLQPVAGLISDVDMFVINFGESNEISLHVFCFLRITCGSRILLTSTDMHFGENYEWLTYDEQDNARHKCFEKTLLNKNIGNLKRILEDAYVLNACFSEIGDIIIEFDNSVIIEIRVDALYNDFECYRIILGRGETAEHHVITCSNGTLMYSKE